LGNLKTYEMIRLVFNYGTFSLWVMGTKNTFASMIKGGDFETIQLALSVLGGIYTIVLIVDKILGGLVNRKQTRLENERLMKEIWELEDLEEDKVNERHK
tara:strand:+ start:175 stop:474 length:300 start_codon:yes stop_codon:yes gene_type:complete